MPTGVLKSSRQCGLAGTWKPAHKRQSGHELSRGGGRTTQPSPFREWPTGAGMGRFEC